jgi:hypothetical protein
MVGFARIAELGGDASWENAARFFWETVVEQRSVAIGGNSMREHFNPPDDFERLAESREGPETCNTSLAGGNPDRFFDESYAIPAELAGGAGDGRLTVRFAAREGSRTAAVYGVRLLRQDP